MRDHTHKGVRYFADCREALDFRDRYGVDGARVVRYQRGWAVQVRISGPYLGPDGRVSA